ncbi:MAG TPA: hypothetical protein VL742_13850 [Casimicrobiaceae bacterium]|nr:hypothetical protein [Casimicrobiaceae bacterium]
MNDGVVGPAGQGREGDWLKRRAGKSRRTGRQRSACDADGGRKRQNGVAKEKAMAWFLIEAGVALALAVFIVWFTMGGRRKRPPDEHDGEQH